MTTKRAPTSRFITRSSSWFAGESFRDRSFMSTHLKMRMGWRSYFSPGGAKLMPFAGLPSPKANEFEGSNPALPATRGALQPPAAEPRPPQPGDDVGTTPHHIPKQ